MLLLLFSLASERASERRSVFQGVVVIGGGGGGGGPPFEHRLLSYFIAPLFQLQSIVQCQHYFSAALVVRLPESLYCASAVAAAAYRAVKNKYKKMQ